MKTVKKKVAELTPDWLLSNFCEDFYMLDDGQSFIFIDDIRDRAWIALAFETLGVVCEAYVDEEEAKDPVFIFRFQIEDVKIECPIFYEFFTHTSVVGKSNDQDDLYSFENEAFLELDEESESLNCA